MGLLRKFLKRRVVLQLSYRKSFAVRSHAAGLLAKVMGEASPEEMEEIASFPGLLEGIVALLSLEVSAGAQEKALKAFNALVVTTESRRRMVSVPRALENLVNLFSRTTARRIQNLALLGFMSLIADFEIGSTVISTPGVLSSLADLTYRDLPKKIKFRAAQALLLLSATREKKMDFFPTAITCLSSLMPHISQRLKCLAADTLAYLTEVYSEDQKVIMASSSETVHVLLRLMCEEESEEVRIDANTAYFHIRSHLDLFTSRMGVDTRVDTAVETIVDTKVDRAVETM